MQAGSLTTRIIVETASWDAMREAWNDLYASSPSASTPLDHVWLRSWWHVYGHVYGADGLRIITVWNNTQLLGALPLYLARGEGGRFGAKRLRFISTGEAEFEETCADYLNLLYRPGAERACVEAVWSAIEDMSWHELDLRDLPAASPLLGDRCHNLRGGARTTVSQHGCCAIAELEDGFEAYIGTLSSKSRMRARQELRKFAKSGAAFELADISNAAQFFDDLVRVHQQRWTAAGKPGCFSAPRFTAFHRQLIERWVPSGRVILARLSHKGEAIAVLYGFVTGRKFDLYQLGVQRAGPDAIHSPGMLANLLLMSRLADRGIVQYDFLRTLSPFKRSLTSIESQLVCLSARRPSARNALSMLIAAAGRARKRLRPQAVGES